MMNYGALTNNSVEDMRTFEVLAILLAGHILFTNRSLTNVKITLVYIVIEY
jgi:hypothetical protein